MQNPVTESSAWSLILALRAAELGTPRPVRVHHSASDAVWLQTDATGEWLASGPLSEAATGLVDLYLPLQLDADLVIGQIGQSLDGRIATERGHSHYITGQADILRLHRLRALVDAVVVGASTVAADDPRLTVREVEGANPVRVVIDPDARLSAEHAVFKDGAARTLVIHRTSVGSTTDAEVISLPAARSEGTGDGAGRSAPGSFAKRTNDRRSHGPASKNKESRKPLKRWWLWVDSNYRPRHYECQYRVTQFM